MKLFDESQNKYFELLTKIINEKKEWKQDQLSNYIRNNIVQSDYIVEDILFNSNEGALLFGRDGQFIKCFVNKHVPVRATKIEKQAVAELLDGAYADYFLDKELKKKIQKAISSVNKEWNLNDVVRRNVFFNSIEHNQNIVDNFRAIMETVVAKKGIRCTNNGKKGDTVFPIKIEYSMAEDQFRVCAFTPSEERFIKINLERIDAIEITEDKCTEDLNAKYITAMNEKRNEIVLEVSTEKYIIERCFRLFSFYEREALYDKENEKYIMKIRFNEADSRAELIRDILSLGSYVVVIEPEEIRIQVINRIRGAIELYNR